MRLPSYLGLCFLGTFLAGCAGDSLSLAGGGSTPDKEPGAYTAAEPSGATSAGFNPFSSQPETSSGGREVIANPTVAEIMQTGPLPEMAWGRADAPVTIIKYASLTCPYCRKFHLETFPQLKRAYIDTGKVRFIIREFPIGKSSGNATIALRCAPPSKYLDLYGKFLAQQASWVSQEVRMDKIYEVASQVGMTRQQFDACFKNQGMIDGLRWVKERGRKLGVIGTPNFFVQGRLVKSVLGMKEIRELVDPLLASPSTAAAGTASR